MSSRLDRLFTLLESGSSAPTRRAAAKQLGEVQKLHPHELHSLLRRIKTLLNSSSWDTRVAAGQAVAAVVACLPPWNPIPTENGSNITVSRPPILNRFDIKKILKSGAHLTGSEGTEYDVESGKTVPTVATTGLSFSQDFGVDLNEIITAEDLILTSEQPKTITQSVSEMVEGEISQAGGQSSRERNLARRRAKVRPLEIPKPDSGESDESIRKRCKLSDSPVTAVPTVEDETPTSPEAVPDGTGSWINANEWPLQSFCDDLLQELFSSRWESRHGAATALREVIIGHGEGAGRSIPSTKAQMDADHEAWLQDAAFRILSVLSLDRFGDFVSDTVVAPVRETCAQVLGALFKLLNPDSVRGVLHVIEQMCQQTPWETRHGALLALKYCLSVRKDLVEEVLNAALPLAAARLYDDVDDVSGVAAAALVPVADDIARLMAHQIPDLIRKLWSLLADQDDLAAASHAFMGLLAALLNCPAASGHIKSHNLDEILPRLWPFIGHNSTAVRRSTLQTLQTLTNQPVICSTETLQITLRHLYQRTLFEPATDILNLLNSAWNNIVDGSERGRLMEAVCPWFGTWLCLAMQHSKLPFDHTFLLTTSQTEGQILYLGGGENASHSMLVRVTAARMLGLVSRRLLEGDLEGSDSPLPYYANVLLTHFASKSALQRLICGLVLMELHRLRSDPLPSNDLNSRVLICATESVVFDEIATPLARLLTDSRDFVSQFPQPRPEPATTLEAAIALTKLTVPTDLVEHRANFQTAVELVQQEYDGYSIAVQAALAGSIVHSKNLGDRLSPVAKPLMDSVRRETEEILQRQSAENLALLVSLCVKRTPCPNSKIISNLRACLAEDFPPCKSFEILTSLKQQREVDKFQIKRQNSQNRGPGRPPLVPPPLSPAPDPAAEKKERMNIIQRRGAMFALQAMARLTGSKLPEELPQLWAALLPPADPLSLPSHDLISNFQVLEVVASALHSSLLPQVLDRLPTLSTSLHSELPGVRHTAARAFATLALLSPELVMQALVTQVLPLLASPSTCKRAGAAEVITCVITQLKLSILPYVVLLLVPLLGRMADSDTGIRILCTQSFASLVQIMPLDGPHLNTGLLANVQAQERLFLSQLLNPASIPDFVIPITVNAQLRAYQQAGINWLAFLNKYKLHGILCDDMGLGKTIQTICIIASDHFNKSSNPSLVICPPTLTGHWVAEVEKFVTREHLSPLLYAGAPNERQNLRILIDGRTLVVASYDIVRKDIEYFQTINWNYCVLDEGHVIKNGKTKASKAIKSLTANHRLILSGTPIQNNVLELWSLFDFLMPGFLGSERQFNSKFARPILASRDAKVSSKEQEAGILAMEALHRQVLPFLLRRVKENVLKDLPPRITQDYICELSPLQELLYEDFSRTQAHQHLEDSLSHSNAHIFQALRYLQNVCNHPQLVLTPQHPQYEKIQRMLQQQNSTINDIQHACKLPALKQLLLDCGIGLGNDAPMTQHRALIFCQLKAMLGVVERLLKHHLPGVSYLRLDGSIPPLQRHNVVNKFNSDPTIDVLLLTTHVGGLGLNLTGADTVIFVEHDWNPMKDLQAMDRAHRIGQKKVVNVYRLITKATLEEKIMGLQKFKLQTANTVISQQNSALETMGTHGLLDLFSLQSDGHKPKESPPGRSLLDTLPDLWEQNQYDEEYDLSSFVSQLASR